MGAGSVRGPRTRGNGSRRGHRIVGIALLSASAAARPETSREFWPEFNAFLKVDERARVYLLATTSAADDDAGSLSATDGTVGVHFDYALTPAFRSHLLAQDWARNRYLWTRVGYQYVHSLGDAGSSFHENRGVFELTARTPPLAGELEWVGRLRWDLRDRNGENSSLYRLRLGAERQFEFGGHAAVPYLNAEAVYDTRYNDWKQMRYQAGVEIALNDDWRIEPYFEAHNDKLAEPARVRAFGLVLKFYR